MTQEQKAEAYDRALKNMRKFRDALSNHEETDLWVLKKEIVTDIEYYFPELKESEDERIRKAAIVFVEASDHFYYHLGISKEDVIAWLEKQSQTFTKKDVDDAYLKGVCDAKNEIEKQYKADYQIRKDIATFIFNYRGDIKDRAKWMNYLGIKVSFDKKQGEQKPAIIIPKFRVGDEIKASNEESLTVTKIDEKGYWSEDLFICSFEDSAKWELVEQKTDDKVEPKFKVDDWVVTDKNDVVQIKAVNNGYYTIDNGMDFNMPYVDRCWRRWDITKDAKPGDVLANDHHILILKELDYNWGDDGTPSAVKAYCGIKPNGNFEIGKDNWCFCGTLHIHPATKEQRDTLLKAMADAGFTFDEL